MRERESQRKTCAREYEEQASLRGALLAVISKHRRMMSAKDYPSLEVI